MQTFLFYYGDQMADKIIGLIVSSSTSGITGVEADAKRLIPDGKFLSRSLWIRSAQTSNCHSLISEGLESIGYKVSFRRRVDLSFLIVDRIHSILEEKGLKQKDLANMLGKKESGISKWMRGTHNFMIETISSVENVLGVPILQVAGV